MSEPSGVNSSPSGDRLSDEAPITRVVQICNKKGLHARASAKFVQLVEKFDADVRVKRGNEIVGGTSIMGLMMLAAGPGTSITIEASGNQAAARWVCTQFATGKKPSAVLMSANATASSSRAPGAAHQARASLRPAK